MYEASAGLFIFVLPDHKIEVVNKVSVRQLTYLYLQSHLKVLGGRQLPYYRQHRIRRFLDYWYNLVV